MKMTDRKIWDAMEILSCAIKEKARETVAANPRGAREGDELGNLQMEAARVASMELSNAISKIFDKY